MAPGKSPEIGAGVRGVKPGDRVASIFMQTRIGGEIERYHVASSLGGSTDGILADYVVFDHERLVQVPAHLSFEEAATLACAGVTA